MTASRNTAFISAGDSNNYGLLREWVHSLHSFPENKSCDICILDLGLNAEQLAALSPHVRQIIRPDWPFEIPSQKIRDNNALKARICRPFLPALFPGYQTYFWMDPDTWIQNWDGVTHFLDSAQKKLIAITQQSDPGFARYFHYLNDIRSAFGFGAARSAMSGAIPDTAAFALHAEAPHWKRWQELMQRLVLKGKAHNPEQAALAVLCHSENFGYEIMPAWTHWPCAIRPLWDENTGKFLIPRTGHEEIGIMNLSGAGEMRRNRLAGVNFQTPQGNSMYLTCRYPHFDGDQNMELKNDLPSAHEVPRGFMKITGTI